MAQSGHGSADFADRRAPHLREVGAEIGPSPIAAELYEARTRYGLDLADVADELRIGYDQLVALEEGRFDDLPGPPYIIGFLRSYAAYLGLDGDDVVRRFKAEAADFTARHKLEFPSPVEEGRVPTGALIGLTLMLAVAAYVGWYYVTSVDSVATEGVPEVPAGFAAAVAPDESAAPAAAVAAPIEVAETPPLAVAEPSPPPRTASATPEIEVAELAPPAESEPAAQAETRTELAPEPDEAAPGIEEVAAADPVAGPGVDEVAAVDPMAGPGVEEVPAIEPVAERSSPPVDEAAVQEIPAVPAPVVELTGYVPRVFGAGNVASRVEVRAELETWVQVTGENNELLLTRILRPGDVYHVPDRPGLVMMTGNAGGLTITVGEVRAPSLGPVGAVRRGVSLDPERLLAGTAVAR